jgi:hypothetical protein
MDDKHVLALVEAIHGAYLDAVHVFALDATFDNDIGHFANSPGAVTSAWPFCKQGLAACAPTLQAAAIPIAQDGS